MTFKDINDGYSFEVYDNEGYLCTVSKEVKERIEALQKENERLKELLEKMIEWEELNKAVKQELKE